MQLTKILARENRGIVVDLIVFGVQLLLMRVLVTRLAVLIEVSKEDNSAKLVVAGYCLAMCFMQPFGVLLKRCSVQSPNDEARSEYGTMVEKLGCYYFVSQLILIGAAISFIFSILGQQHFMDAVCLGQVAVSAGLASLNLWIINLYLTQPKNRILRRICVVPQVEWLGDVFIMVGLVLWQMLWGYLIFKVMRNSADVPQEFMWLGIFMPQKEYSTSAKLGWFMAAFFVFYLSPRFVYLVHDRRRKLAWLTILLANSPALYRIFFPMH